MLGPNLREEPGEVRVRIQRVVPTDVTKRDTRIVMTCFILEHVFDKDSIKNIFREMPLTANRLGPSESGDGLNAAIEQLKRVAPPCDQISNVRRAQVVTRR